MRTIHFFCVFCFLATQVGNLHAAKPLREITVRYRENGADHIKNVIPFNTSEFGTEYANGEDCGNSAHKTKTMPGRFLAHCHIDVDVPDTGSLIVLDASNYSFLYLTKEKIKDYWDKYYGPPRVGYSGGEGVTLTTNCWGWALDDDYSDCWVEDPTYIYEDNYSKASANPTILPTRQTVDRQLNLNGKDSHVQKIAVAIYAPLGPGTTPSAFYNTGISEKNRDSGIYSATYGGYSSLPTNVYVRNY